MSSTVASETTNWLLITSNCERMLCPRRLRFAGPGLALSSGKGWQPGCAHGLLVCKTLPRKRYRGRTRPRLVRWMSAPNWRASWRA